MFMAYVESLQVLTYEHQVDVLIASAGNDRTHGTQIGVQTKFFAEADVYRSVAVSDRGGQGAFQGQMRAADTIQRILWKRVIRGSYPSHSTLAYVPLEWGSKLVKNRSDRFDDL